MHWVEARHPSIKPQRLGGETVRRMIDQLVTDLLKTSAAAIERAAPAHIDDVRALPQPLIRFSPPLGAAQLELKRFLRDELYSHPRVRQMTQQAQETVRLLFDSLSADYGGCRKSMRSGRAPRRSAAIQRARPGSSPTTSRA